MTSRQPRTTAGLHAAVHTSVRTLTPHLELQGTLALVATDRTLRRLMTTARAPLDLWARPWPLAKLEQALMRFGAADGAVNAATADGLVLAASKTRVGALLHVSLHQTASPLPAPVAAHLPSLRTLHLAAVNAEDLEQIGGCAQLRGLTLQRVRVRAGRALELGPLRRCGNLEHLSVQQIGYGDGGGDRSTCRPTDLTPLAACTSLTHLSLPPGPGGEAIDASPLSSLSLESLEWVADPAGVASGDAARSLTHLGLRGADLDAPLLAALAQLPRLASIEFRGCRFPSVHGLATLPSLPKLEKASFRSCAGGVDLEPLADRCPNLSALLLVAESGHDRPRLEGLARFPKLRELTVRGTLPYAAALFREPPALERLETLTVRGLSYTAFADAAAKNTCFPNLVEFNGAAADDARAYESAKVQDHNRKYRQTYADARAEGLAPAAAMRRAADAVGDLVAPRCGPKLRADDKPKPPRKFL